MKKRIFAFLLSVVMTLSMGISVAAADPDVRDYSGGTPPTATATSDVADANLEGTGTLVGFDVSSLHLVTVPTDSNFDFILDPMGLTSIKQDTSQSLGQLEGGKVIHKEPAIVINNSAFPIEVKASFEMEAPEVIFATNAVAAATSREHRLFMHVAPGSKNMTTGDVNEAVAGPKGYVLTGDAIDLNFAFDKATWRAFSSNEGSTNIADYTFYLDTGADGKGTGKGTSFHLDGKINPAANWSASGPQAYGGADIKLKVVFEFTTDPDHYVFANVHLEDDKKDPVNVGVKFEEGFVWLIDTTTLTSADGVALLPSGDGAVVSLIRQPTATPRTLAYNGVGDLVIDYTLGDADSVSLSESRYTAANSASPFVFNDGPSTANNRVTVSIPDGEGKGTITFTKAWLDLFDTSSDLKIVLGFDVSKDGVNTTLTLPTIKVR